MNQAKKGTYVDGHKREDAVGYKGAKKMVALGFITPNIALTPEAVKVKALYPKTLKHLQHTKLTRPLYHFMSQLFKLVILNELDGK